MVQQLILNDYKGVFVDEFISHYTLGGFSGSWDNKYRVYTCTSLLAKKSLYFYRQFYPDMDEDEAQMIYWHCNDYKAYPRLFLEKMVRFMVEKKLNNFNYDNFINYINSIITGYYEKKLYTTSKFYFLNFIKIFSLKRKGENKLYIKLFGFIPLLKIKEE